MAQTLSFCRVPGKPWATDAIFPALPPCTNSRTTFDLSIWPFPSSFRRTPPVVTTHPPRSVLRRSRSSSQPVDQPQYFLEQFWQSRAAVRPAIFHITRWPPASGAWVARITTKSASVFRCARACGVAAGPLRLRSRSWTLPPAPAGRRATSRVRRPRQRLAGPLAFGDAGELRGNACPGADG